MLNEGNWGAALRRNLRRALLCASSSALQIACAAKPETHSAVVGTALPSAQPIPSAQPVVERESESSHQPAAREWPACTEPSAAPRLEAWPLIEFPQAVKHELPAELAQFNVRATLSAIERTDPCAESSEHWWPAQKCTGDSFVTLSLTGAAPSPTLNALAALSFWGGSLDIGRQYEFSLTFCRGTTGAPVARVSGFEALGRVAGGDPRECQARNHDNWPYRPIESLRVNDVLPGGFRTTGYVIQCLQPAPCPPHIVCKPQASPSLMLAASLEPSAPMIRLDEPCGKRFKVGKRYDLAIVLESTNTMGLTNIGHSCAAPVPH